MNSNLGLSHSADAQHQATPRLTRTTLVAASVALICVFAATYNYGRTALEAAARADAAAIESENQAFCAELGLVAQSGAYGNCARELTEIRRHHEQRLNAQAAGIL